jgi:hypothetical protein
MRKINLDPYQVQIPKGDGTMVADNYEVRESIIQSLYAPALRLGVRELLDNDRLAQKIKQAGSDLLLEEEEYSRVLKAFETIINYTQNDVELVRRVLDAPEVPVKEG